MFGSSCRVFQSLFTNILRRIAPLTFRKYAAQSRSCYLTPSSELKLQTPAAQLCTCETLLCNHVASSNSFYSDNLWDVLDNLPKNVQEPFMINLTSCSGSFNETMHSSDVDSIPYTPRSISPPFASVPFSVSQPKIKVRDFGAQTQAQMLMVCLYFRECQII